MCHFPALHSPFFSCIRFSYAPPLTVVLLRLRALNRLRGGGGKKRKKKVYTKPKKIAHKNKRVQLAVLKYYKVDDNGKITRLRKDCPECGE